MSAVHAVMFLVLALAAGFLGTIGFVLAIRFLALVGDVRWRVDRWRGDRRLRRLREGDPR